MQEKKLQTSELCFFAGLMNLLTQLSDRIHHLRVYNLMPLDFLTNLFNMDGF